MTLSMIEGIFVNRRTLTIVDLRLMLGYDLVANLNLKQHYVNNDFNVLSLSHFYPSNYVLDSRLLLLLILESYLSLTLKPFVVKKTC